MCHVITKSYSELGTIRPRHTHIRRTFSILMRRELRANAAQQQNQTQNLCPH